MLQNKTTFMFDMDGTLAESREAAVWGKNLIVLQNLIATEKHVVIVSAGSSKRILKQVADAGGLQGKWCVMGNYGLDCATVFNNVVMQEKKHSYVESIDEQAFCELIREFRRMHALEDYCGKSYVLSDTGLIAIALLGTEVACEKRKSYDQDRSVRACYIEHLNSMLPSNFKAYIGGQTSIDIIHKNHDKSSAIVRWANEFHCPLEKIVFFGDEITIPFGNDSSLLHSGIDYVEVKTFRDVAERYLSGYATTEAAMAK